MNLLRRLQFHQIRATHIATDLLFSRSFCSSLTGTRWPCKVFSHDVKDASYYFPVPNIFCRHVHVSYGSGGRLSQSTDSDSLLERVDAVETVEQKSESDSTATVTNDSSLLVKGQVPLSKDVLKSDFDSEKPESLIHVDESKRELFVYVGNELVKAKAKDLYKAIRKMDSEEVTQ